jgi:hypothetical protein
MIIEHGRPRYPQARDVIRWGINKSAGMGKMDRLVTCLGYFSRSELCVADFKTAGGDEGTTIPGGTPRAETGPPVKRSQR